MEQSNNLFKGKYGFPIGSPEHKFIEASLKLLNFEKQYIDRVATDVSNIPKSKKSNIYTISSDNINNYKPKIFDNTGNEVINKSPELLYQESVDEASNMTPEESKNFAAIQNEVLNASKKILDNFNMRINLPQIGPAPELSEYEQRRRRLLGEERASLEDYLKKDAQWRKLSPKILEAGLTAAALAGLVATGAGAAAAGWGAIKSTAALGKTAFTIGKQYLKHKVKLKALQHGIKRLGSVATGHIKQRIIPNSIVPAIHKSGKFVVHHGTEHGVLEGLIHGVQHLNPSNDTELYQVEPQHIIMGSEKLLNNKIPGMTPVIGISKNLPITNMNFNPYYK